MGIRISNPGGICPSSLLLGHKAFHNIEFLRMSGEETFCFFETWMPERGSNPRSPTFKAGSFNHCTNALALIAIQMKRKNLLNHL